MYTKKPLGFGYGFKSHCLPINERFSNFKGYCQSRISNQKLIFPPFGNDFYLNKKIIVKGHPVLYSLKIKYICDYNLRCIMSIGLIFDDIITNILRNKALECHVQVVDSYFKNTENNTIHMCRWSLQ